MSISESKRSRSTQQGSSPPTETVYFLSLTVRNARCFGDEAQTLNLKDENGRPAQWTILLGNNGTGKTTLLQSLVGFNNGDLSSQNLPYRESLRRIRFRRWYSDWTLDGFMRDDEMAIEISTIIGKGTALTNIKGSYFNQLLSFSFSGDFEGRTGTFEWLPHDAPHCYAYGASRRLGRSTLTEFEQSDATNSLFREDADLLNAEEWLLRLDYSASKSSDIQAQQSERLEQVKDLLRKILPDVSDIRFVSPATLSPNPKVEFKTPYGWVRLSQLGYGYRTLIAWMADFASRMFDRYPESPDPLAEPAVVLVDEIDLHLHPQWQRTLISYLTERFPNTQFIVTAHSPLIVQAALGVNANIAVLRREGDHVVIDNDKSAIQGWRIDQLLTSDLFELPSARPPNLDQPLSRRRELLSKPKLTKKDRTELAALEKQIGTLPIGETDEQARKMMELVEETQRLLREREKKGK